MPEECIPIDEPKLAVRGLVSGEPVRGNFVTLVGGLADNGLELLDSEGVLVRGYVPELMVGVYCRPLGVFEALLPRLDLRKWTAGEAETTPPAFLRIF